ncbi:hypothetical protein AVEN_136443-1 [Araneus ventricosus]|uniref:Uncharacterized protein n=1 Tax=Araneus ventricosus TaxID=182803 RepID=A0A4Y2JIT9_ARAVE|nr:hypothetical protein AVEN_136443-1 [Araneus ventricosus]
MTSLLESIRENLVEITPSDFLLCCAAFLHVKAAIELTWRSSDFAKLIFECLLLEMAKCHENIKAVQRVWEEEFHNKNWPDKRTINVCSHVMDGFQNRLIAVLAKDGGHFNPLYR